MTRSPIFTIAFLAALVCSASIAVAHAATPFVTAKAPLNQSVKALVRGKFKQTVTCRTSCKVIARVFVRPQVARKLGFKRVKSGEPFAIGLKQTRLAGRKQTTIRMALGTEAKRRLAKFKGRLQLTGQTYAQATSSKTRGQASWVTMLRR